MARFLVSLLAVLATYVLLCWEVMAEDASIFQVPLRLKADGKVIDTGEAWGHSGPAVADVDIDGLRDLVVGDFSGKFRFYRNIGSNKEPKFAACSYLMADGKEAEVPIYCCIGSSPHFVDFDDDGKLDMISGSYDPGECYLFRGRGDGTFAKRETLVDKSGTPILRKPKQQQRFESFGSWPVMVDWDNDGDLDLVIGGFDGTVFLRINEGSRQKPVFSEANVFLQVGDAELKVPGDPAGHAAPAIADWDGDGLWDLLCGSERGSVYFYRNSGDRAAPRFEAGQEIVPPHQGSGYEELLAADADPLPGIRSQIAAMDYNGDGKMDLILGDFCTNLVVRPGLTKNQQDELLGLRKQAESASAALKKSMDDMRDDFVKRYPGDKIYSNEATAEWSKAYQAWKGGKEFTTYEKVEKDINKEMSKFLVKPETKGTFNDDATNHGYVWLFLRK